MCKHVIFKKIYIFLFTTTTMYQINVNLLCSKTIVTVGYINNLVKWKPDSGLSSVKFYI